MDVVRQTIDDEELKDRLFRISLEAGIGLDEYGCPYGRPVELPELEPPTAEQQEIRTLINRIACDVAKQSQTPNWQRIFESSYEMQNKSENSS